MKDYLTSVKHKYAPVSQKELECAYLTTPAKIFPNYRFYDLDTVEFPEGMPEAFHHDTYYQFAPDISPNTIIRLGFAGGVYFGNCKPNSMYEEGLKAYQSLPKKWFSKTYKSDVLPKYQTNFFKVCSRDLPEYNAPFNPTYITDPLGWFQWYCNFFQGRRIPYIDNRQIYYWCRVAQNRNQVAHDLSKGKLKKITLEYQQFLFEHAINPFF